MISNAIWNKRARMSAICGLLQVLTCSILHEENHTISFWWHVCKNVTYIPLFFNYPRAEISPLCTCFRLIYMLSANQHNDLFYCIIGNINMFVGGRCSCGNEGRNQTRRVDLTITAHGCIKRYTKRKNQVCKSESRRDSRENKSNCNDSKFMPQLYI